MENTTINTKWTKEYRAKYKKDYIEKNRDRINEYNREYRKKHPEIYKKRLYCSCCDVYIKSNMYQHERTKKHQMKIELNNLKNELENKQLEKKNN